MGSGKIILGVALAAAIFAGWKYFNELKNKFVFKIKGYGIPSLQNWILKLPITIQFNNPTGMVINPEKVFVDVYVKDKTNNYVHVGQVNQPVSIPPGSSDQTIVAVVGMQSLANVLVNSWSDLLKSKSIVTRTNVTIVYMGVQLPTQEIVETVKI